MTNEKAFQMGQYAAYKNKPRNCPFPLEAIDSRCAWYQGYDNEIAGQRLDRGIRDEPILRQSAALCGKARHDKVINTNQGDAVMKTYAWDEICDEIVEITDPNQQTGDWELIRSTVLLSVWRSSRGHIAIDAIAPNIIEAEAMIHSYLGATE